MYHFKVFFFKERLRGSKLFACCVCLWASKIFHGQIILNFLTYLLIYIKYNYIAVSHHSMLLPERSGVSLLLDIGAFSLHFEFNLTKNISPLNLP